MYLFYHCYFKSNSGRFVSSILAIWIASAITVSVLAQVPTVTYLGMMQTADTLGKGGTATRAGILAYTRQEKSKSDTPQTAVIGNFAELQEVKFNAKSALLPVGLTFGISENVDLTLAGTYAIGQIHKEIPNFYQTDDPDRNVRVYPQPVFDGEIAVKYGIKPEAQDGLPAVSLFGSVRSGFTADDRLDAEGEFLDQTPANGLPFLGVETQILVTQRLGQALRLHAAGGVHMSSKGLRIIPLLQIGVEFALSDSIWATADFSKTVFVNGFKLDNVSSGGLRYDINGNASLSLFLVSKPGLQFDFTFGGAKEEVVIPQAPEDDMDLPF